MVGELFYILQQSCLFKYKFKVVSLRNDHFIDHIWSHSWGLGALNILPERINMQEIQ